MKKLDDSRRRENAAAGTHSRGIVLVAFLAAASQGLGCTLRRLGVEEVR